MIHIVAPEGQMLRNIVTGAVHKEVFCRETQVNKWVVEGSEADPEVAQVALPGAGAGAGTIVDPTISTRLDELEEELAAAKILLGVE